MNQPLITKYRPTEWDEMVGHEEVIGSLRRAIDSDSRPHSYLFTGVAGIGKTTLARIVAKELGCEVIELDAASNSGADAMRQIIEVGQHRSLSGAGKRMFILDEVHRASRTALDVLLKTLEEPPEHLYFALCTTDLAKLPTTIVSRCFHTALRQLKPVEIEALLTVVADLEGWKVANDVIDAIVLNATGQPRIALKLLQSLHDAKNREEVGRIITLMDAGEPLIALLQTLIRGNKSWERVQLDLLKMEDEAFAEAKIIAGRYFVGALIKTKDAKQAQNIYQLLSALTFPTQTHDPKVEFVVGLGRMLWE